MHFNQWDKTKWSESAMTRVRMIIKIRDKSTYRNIMSCIVHTIAGLMAI